MSRVYHQNNLDRKAWGCPHTKNRTNWCYAYCVPQDGRGDCGRYAPHAIKGRTQRAILAYRAAHPEEN